MLALNRGRPVTFNLRDVIEAFIAFREEMITKRTVFELKKAREKAHILGGLAVAVANIDEVIAIIRKAPDPQAAREELTAKHWPAKDIAPLIALVDDPEYPVANDNTYKMSDLQAKAILDLRLHRLTGLERDKIGDDLRVVTDDIKRCLTILGSRSALYEVMRGEFLEIKERFAEPRRTQLIEAESETVLEDLIAREDMVVTVSSAGYVKRVPLSTYRAQKRGGKGRTGMTTKDEDFVTDLFVANTHTPLLFFTTKGIVHKMKVYKIPEGTPQSRGKAFVNLLPLAQDEKISVVMPLPEDEAAWDNLDVVLATSQGTIRRNNLSTFQNIRSNGLIAMKLEGDERLIAVKTCTDQDDILIASRKGKAIRFALDEIRVFKGRASTGVRGINLGKGDEVMSVSILRHMDVTAEERSAYLKMAAKARQQDDEAIAGENAGDDENVAVITLSEERYQQLAAAEEFLCTVTSKGFGKRTSAYEYRTTGRGGQGVWNMKLSEKNGEIVSTFPVQDRDQIMMVTDGGQVIRMPIKDVRFVGRQTQGVTLFRVSDGEQVVSAAVIASDDDDADSDITE
jgi:DNA gyrase subunit A